MIGFLLGTACLVGLVKVARHGRGCGDGPGYGGGSCGSGGYGGGGWGRGRRGGFGRWGRRGGGIGPTMFLRHAFERLDTTPGQEKVILQAFDELQTVLKKAKGDFKGTREDFARAIRGEVLDEASVADIFMKHDTTISETRRGVVDQLHKIHEALTEKQREQLASFLEHGPREGFGRWGGGGPYRQDHEHHNDWA